MQNIRRTGRNDIGGLGDRASSTVLSIYVYVVRECLALSWMLRINGPVPIAKLGPPFPHRRKILLDLLASFQSEAFLQSHWDLQCAHIPLSPVNSCSSNPLLWFDFLIP